MRHIAVACHCYAAHLGRIIADLPVKLEQTGNDVGPEIDMLV
mgnify:CR=1 FL=1|tara:strand:+ start:22227 stop:22352 length:126 start_codon:yes stop_codon:yes gene_type:complete